MAYGQGDKDSLKRMVPLGTGALTRAKGQALLDLRQAWCAAANTLVDPVWLDDPLAQPETKQQLHDALYDAQKRLQGLNAAYKQKVQIAVTENVWSLRQRYLKALVGRAKHVASVIKRKPLTGATLRRAEARAAKGLALQRWHNVPVGLQDRVAQADLDALAECVKSLDFTQTLNLLRAVCADGLIPDGYSDIQLEVLRAIHRMCLERYGKPTYGADDAYTCQIHLDYRVVLGEPDAPKGTKKLDHLLGRLRGEANALLLADDGNGLYKAFLEVSNPIPRGDPIRVPLTLSTRTLKRLVTPDTQGGTPVLKSLVLEVFGTRLAVKGVLDRTPEEAPLSAVTHILGRDFGYRNTCSWSVLELAVPLNPERVAELQKLDKEQARAYLQSHHAPTGEHAVGTIVQRRQVSGRGFLAHLESMGKRIDDLRSEIDLTYLRLHRIGGLLRAKLGLPDGEHLPEAWPDPADVHHGKLLGKFFRVLASARRLKEIRRAVYDRAEGVKKAWLGFVANTERAIARKVTEAGGTVLVVHEDLTLVTVENDAPEYRGSTFNRMVNNGCKGRYTKAARGKHGWDGVPSVAVPSYHTSSTCVVHALVDQGMRNKRTHVFRCPRCGRPEDDDLHASDTIAFYLALKPVGPASVDGDVEFHVTNEVFLGGGGVLAPPVLREAPAFMPGR